MGKINAGRVLLGGLLAGVVINVSEWFWNGVVFVKEMEDAIAKLGKPTDMGGGTMAIFVALGLSGRDPGGVAVRGDPSPLRRGPPNTAMRAGLMMWLLVYVSMTISMAPDGPVPSQSHAARLADQFG